MSNKQKNNDGGARMRFIIKCLAIAVCTKNNNWDDAAYQKGVVAPYTVIKTLVENCEQTGADPTDKEIKIAFASLQQIFETKLTPQEEQEYRFNELFDIPGMKDLLLEHAA